MNLKNILPALMLGCAFTAMADGYTDGIQYYKAGQYDNAKTILERTINDASTDKALSYYYLGQIALRNGDTATAKADFEKGISANAECAFNYVGMGAVALKNNDVKGAEDFFKQAQKLGKKNSAITVDIARAYYNADKVKYDKKVAEFIAKAHKESKNREASIYILEGDMIFDQQNPDLLGDAAAQYEMAIMYDEANPEGYVKYANAYMGVNPQYGVAKLEELLSKQPTSALAQRELAEKYYSTSQWTKAAEQYGKYIQNPNHFPEDKARYAVLLYANKDYDNSIAVCDEILASDPNNFQLLRVKMLDLAELNRNEEAAQVAEKFFALPVDPSTIYKFTPNDYIIYGNVLTTLEKPELALEAYKKAVEVDPTRPDSWKAVNGAYADLQQFQDAAEAYDQFVALSEKPTLNDFYMLSAQWLRAANAVTEDPVQKAEDADKGILAINKVLEAVENGQATPNPLYNQRLALLYYMRSNLVPDDDTAKAFQDLLALLDTDPANADPTNPKNQLTMYQQAYGVLSQYYKERDPEMQKAMMEKLSALPH